MPLKSSSSATAADVNSMLLLSLCLAWIPTGSCSQAWGMLGRHDTSLQGRLQAAWRGGVSSSLQCRVKRYLLPNSTSRRVSELLAADNTTQVTFYNTAVNTRKTKGMTSTSPRMRPGVQSNMIRLLRSCLFQGTSRPRWAGFAQLLCLFCARNCKGLLLCISCNQQTRHFTELCIDKRGGPALKSLQCPFCSVSKKRGLEGRKTGTRDKCEHGYECMGEHLGSHWRRAVPPEIGGPRVVHDPKVTSMSVLLKTEDSVLLFAHCSSVSSTLAATPPESQPGVAPITECSSVPKQIRF